MILLLLLPLIFSHLKTVQNNSNNITANIIFVVKGTRAGDILSFSQAFKGQQAREFQKFFYVSQFLLTPS
jgi:hypothetical protein